MYNSKDSLLKNKGKFKDENFYKCYQCSRICKNLSNLRIHLRLHSGERPYKCLQCDKTFIHLSSFSYHRKVHSNLRDFKCNICDKKFIQRSDLKKHLKAHIRKNPSISPQCKQVLQDLNNFSSHGKINFQKKSFKYEICKKKLDTKFKLKIHSQVHKGENFYKCNICEKTFIKFKNLQQHKKIHSGIKPFECDFCKKRFFEKVYLRQHIRIHTGDKPHKCSSCNQSFSFDTSFKRHAKKCHEKVPLRVNIYNQKFISKSKLKNKRNHYENNPIKKLYNMKECFIPLVKFDHMILKNACQIDSNVSKNIRDELRKESENLTNLENKHEKFPVMNKVKVYKCDYCKEIFLQRTAIIDHLKSHYNKNQVKVYKCDICKEIFLRKTLIIAHLKFHSNKKKVIVCKQCNRKFSSEIELDVHVKMHNKESENKSINSVESNATQKINLNNNLENPIAMDGFGIIRYIDNLKESITNLKIDDNKNIHKNQDNDELIKDSPVIDTPKNIFSNVNIPKNLEGAIKNIASNSVKNLIALNVENSLFNITNSETSQSIESNINQDTNNLVEINDLEIIKNVDLNEIFDSDSGNFLDNLINDDIEKENKNENIVTIENITNLCQSIIKSELKKAMKDFAANLKADIIKTLLECDI